MSYVEEMCLNNKKIKVDNRTSLFKKNLKRFLEKYKIIAISIVFVLMLIGIDLILLNNFYSILVKL